MHSSILLQKRIFITVFLTSLLSALANAQPRQTLQAANQAYQDQNYEQAIDLYETLLAEGRESEALYYNLGNAYYRQGEAGRAVLNYERALKLDPDDENTLHNLRFVRRQMPDEVIDLKQSGLVQSWLSLQNSMTSRSWSILGLAMLWLAALGLAVWLLSSIRRRKKWGFITGILLLVLSSLPFLLAYGRARQEFYSNTAVVLAADAVLRSAPEEESQAVRGLQEGMTVRILDDIGNWHKVRLADSTEGWVPKGAVEEV